MERIAGSGAVLALNDVASWNDGIRLCLSNDERLLPSSVSGTNIKTSDVYAFVSTQAGWTSFGAHVDFEHSIIIDLHGSGRDIITWPAGSPYGQRMDEASSFFGISFDWEKYIHESKRERILPGEIAVINQRQPHIFHANGPGLFLGVSAEGTSETHIASPISHLASGPAFVPKNDRNLTRSVMKNHIPPPVRLLDHSLVEINGSEIQFEKNKIALVKDELNLLQSKSIETIIHSYGPDSDRIVRSIVAKLLVIGAAVVYADFRGSSELRV